MEEELYPEIEQTLSPSLQPTQPGLCPSQRSSSTFPAPALAAVKDVLCEGSGKAKGGGTCMPRCFGHRRITEYNTEQQESPAGHSQRHRGEISLGGPRASFSTETAKALARAADPASTGPSQSSVSG